jgi:hypothetical protein
MGIQAGMMLVMPASPTAAFIGFLRPNSDRTSGAWTGVGTGSGLYGRIDETSPDDATSYIKSKTIVAVCASTDSDLCAVELTGPSPAPNGVEVTVVRVRHRRVTTGSIGTNNLRIRLMESTTQRDSWTVYPSTSWATENRTLSQAVKDAIGNWSNVHLEFQYTACMNNDFETTRADITWAEVEFSA